MSIHYYLTQSEIDHLTELHRVETCYVCRFRDIVTGRCSRFTMIVNADSQSCAEFRKTIWHSKLQNKE